MPETKKGWGGSRPGAGRPRTETLDAVECWFLADLLAGQPDADQYAATIARLRRMGDKAARLADISEQAEE